MSRLVAGAAMLMAASACNAILGVEDLNGPGGGEDDAGVDAAVAPPGITMLRSPPMGATTGSAHADASLRPLLQWHPTTGAQRYELAIDDSCQTSSFRTCAFVSPEVMVTDLTITRFTPSAGLAVSLAAPVGRRYFWRVRGCNDIGCGDWSSPWYLDVARLPDDVNGDGYGDLIVGISSGGSSTVQVGAAHIAFGRPGNAVTATTRLADPRSQVDGRFGSAVAMVGDVNADGYADFLVGAWKTSNNNHVGTAYLYLGRGTWPAALTEATTVIALGSAEASASFGGVLTGHSDINGDGYADMVIAATNPLFDGIGGTPTTPGYVYVNFGRPSWSFSQLGSDLVIPDPDGDVMGGFGNGVAADDINEDGLGDLVIGAAGANSFAGETRIYYGQSSYPSTPHVIGAADVMFPSPVAETAAFGAGLALCRDADAAPAIAIGSPAESRPAAFAGAARVYAGRAPWPASVADPDLTLAHPSGALNGSFGGRMRCADIDADGKTDLVVGAPTGDDAGEVYVYGAVADLASSPLVTLTSGDPTRGILGASVAVTDFNGDGVTDIFAGAPNLGSPSNSGRVLGWFGRSVWPSALMAADVTIANPDGLADQRFGRSMD